MVVLRLLEIREISLLSTCFCYLFIYFFDYSVIYLFISTMPAAAFELTLRTQLQSRTLTSPRTCFLISYCSMPASSGVRGTFFVSLPAFSLLLGSTHGGKPPPIFDFFVDWLPHRPRLDPLNPSSQMGMSSNSSVMLHLKSLTLLSM